MIFQNGSIGSIHYLSNGSKSFPKERLEVFADEKVFQLDNFRKLKAWGHNNFSSKRLIKQDKGHRICVREFLKSINDGKESPIPANQIFEVMRLLINAQNKI